MRAEDLWVDLTIALVSRRCVPFGDAGEGGVHAVRPHLIGIWRSEGITWHAPRMVHKTVHCQRFVEILRTTCGPGA
ncbi:hypothetical protein Misp02_68000 [Microtetraspora sp. NBRC 16547]|nr:hypothetical protein Misp02_68000 [Microtetraspora sp. NBRC 16547]